MEAIYRELDPSDAVRNLLDAAYGLDLDGTPSGTDWHTLEAEVSAALADRLYKNTHERPLLLVLFARCLRHTKPKMAPTTSTWLRGLRDGAIADKLPAVEMLALDELTQTLACTDTDPGELASLLMELILLADELQDMPRRDNALGRLLELASHHTGAAKVLGRTSAQLAAHPPRDGLAA